MRDQSRPVRLSGGCSGSSWCGLARVASMRSRGPDLGWRVVAAVCLLLTAVSGFGFYSLTVYLHALTASGAFALTSVSQATALFFLSGGLAGVGIASLLSRFDARPVVAGSAVAMAVALLLLGRVHTVAQLFAVYVLLGAGQAGAGIVPGTTLVARWFVVRRSTALAVATTGLSLGGIAVAPAVAAAAEHVSLRRLMPVVAVIFLAVALVATALLLPDPARLGLAPDGAEHVPGQQPEGALARTALSSKAFWGISGAQALAVLAQVGALTHLYALGAERASTGTGATAVSLAAFSSFAGRFLGGVVLRRVPLLLFGRLLLVAQALSLILLAFAHGPLALLVGAGVFGLTVGNVLLLQPLLVGEAFGLADYARILSRSTLVATVGIAIGPVLLGELHAHAGGYRAGYLAAGLSSLLGGLLLRRTARHLAPGTLPITNPAAVPGTA